MVCPKMSYEDILLRYKFNLSGNYATIYIVIVGNRY